MSTNHSANNDIFKVVIGSRDSPQHRTPHDELPNSTCASSRGDINESPSDAAQALPSSLNDGRFGSNGWLAVRQTTLKSNRIEIDFAT